MAYSFHHGAVKTIIFAMLPLMPQIAMAQARIVDGDTIEIGVITYRINGIDAPEAGQTCQTSTGKSWRCGEASMDFLKDHIAGAVVHCESHGNDGYGRTIATCFAGSRDIGAEMVRAGFAWAFVKYSTDYVSEEADARANLRGIWQGKSEPAWEYRERRWTEGLQQAPKGCPIKGNISENGRIYHTPWSPWYTRTKINEAKGERWFCSEAEAIAAGWRAPRWR